MTEPMTIRAEPLSRFSSADDIATSCPWRRARSATLASYLRVHLITSGDLVIFRVVLPLLCQRPFQIAPA